MTMLKSFDLKGQKQSFANWISNLSPCETPFVSMIPKEKVDQVQYSWQTDRLSAPVNTGVAEGSAPTIAKPAVTTVVSNFTQIYRKAVRVSDTTKKISLYGRANELSLQMEKAGMEIKRDLESALLNSVEAGRPGTVSAHGICAGVQTLVAGVGVADTDTGAIVHKVVTYAANATAKKFTQLQVFDLTYQLYLAGARADKVMVHPMHMHLFSDWIGSNVVTPHVHRMFDGLETKYNAHVSSFRDPLGQVFDIIPNRYMPKNQLFFFNEKDWTQMVLREPSKIELAKNGSSEKHMIEMEVGLRHRNPYASGILAFNAVAFKHLGPVTAVPGEIKADSTQESTVSVQALGDANEKKADAVAFSVETINHDGTTTAATIGATTAATATDPATAKIKHAKGARIKVTAKTSDIANGNDPAASGVVNIDSYEVRD